MSDTQPANPLGSLAQSTVTLLIRHGMSLLAGIMVAHGVIAQSQTAQFVDGAVAVALWAVPVIWSFFQKKTAHKAIAEAQATPVPTTAAAST